MPNMPTAPDCQIRPGDNVVSMHILWWITRDLKIRNLRSLSELCSASSRSATRAR